MPCAEMKARLSAYIEYLPVTYCKALLSPSAVREGADMCVASLRMAPSTKRMVRREWSLCAEKIIVAAASPRLSPQRCLSNGRHNSADKALKEAKPDTINFDNISTPTTTTCSKSSPTSSRLAVI